MRIRVVLRTSGDDISGKNRPAGFSKLRCMSSLFDCIASAPEGCKVDVESWIDGEVPVPRRRLLEASGEVFSFNYLGNAGGIRRIANCLGKNVWEDYDFLFLSEDDYAYRPSWFGQLQEAHELGIVDALTYVTPYDHPDRYSGTLSADRHARARVVQAGDAHWRSHPATCMTFGGSLSLLRRDRHLLRLCAAYRTPQDLEFWRVVLSRSYGVMAGGRRSLMGPLPGAATHMETGQVAPGFEIQATSDKESEQIIRG